MAQVIARIYATADKAAAAANAAKELGYGDRELFVVEPSAGAAKADFAASLAQAGLAKDEADACADEVAKGRSVVIVHAAFGGGAKATAALDKFDPIGAPPTKFTKVAKADAAAPQSTGASAFDDAAPLSSKFGWPTLINNPTPFSDYFKLPVLAPFTSNIQVSNGTTTKVELSDDPAPLSRVFGWKLLTDDPTPLSRKMKWDVLIDDPAPLSRKANWPVLKD